jgi:glycosyltransferase involved in cell wall biosynthesis
VSRTIVHVITALGPGGAESVLGQLVTERRDSTFEHVVISLVDGHWPGWPLKERIEAAGVRVIVLGARRGSIDPRVILRLARVLRQERPAAVQTWMYHADLVGGLAARLAGNPPVAWNIRNGTLAPAFSKRLTLIIARVNALLSRWVPKVIVCCAESVKSIHAEQGFPADRMIVIPNGYDLERFRPDPAARAAIRAEAGVPDDARVIGFVARFHPQKDHKTFFKSAALIGRRYPDVHFILCGEFVNDRNAELRAMIAAADLCGRTHLLGDRNDVPAVQTSLDIACLSSQGGEGFPNVVAEAMACGTPCVVADVGDAARIVGNTGKIVPTGNPEALANALAELLELSNDQRAALGRQARQRIVDRYDIRHFARQYEALYEMLAGAAPVEQWAFGTCD